MATDIARSVAACSTSGRFLDSLAKLEELEKDLLALSAVPCAKYIRLKRYLVQPGPALRAIPRGLVGRPLAPAWKIQRLIRLAREWGRGNLEPVVSTACLIEVRPAGRAIRSFYQPTNSTIKMAVPSPDSHNGIRGEIGARQIVEELGCLKVPKLLGQRVTETCVAFHEEWIDGRPFRGQSDARTVSRVLLPQLARHYQAYGVREEPFEKILGTNFADRIAEASDQFRWPRNWGEKSAILKTVQRLESARLNFSVSFCHNDLHGGNLLFGRDNSPIIIDWEYGAKAAIARDMAELNRCAALASPGLTQQCFDLLAQWESPTTYTPAQQLLLLTLRKVASKCRAWQDKEPSEQAIARVYEAMQIAQRLLCHHPA